MNLTISKMSINDLYSIQNILLSDFDDFWTFSTLENELKCENSYFLVVRNTENKIVGFSGFKVIIDEADIMNIVVNKNFRHQGVGSFLLQNLIDSAKDLSLKSLTLEVNEKNSNAILLYEKFGFEKLGIRKKYYNNIDNAIIMKKDL